MNSAPHLMNEDRRDYERVLDEALRSAPDPAETAPGTRRLTTEQLRAMALAATAVITAAASPEYQVYVAARSALRRPVQPGPGRSPAAPDAAPVGPEDPSDPSEDALLPGIGSLAADTGPLSAAAHRPTGLVTAPSEPTGAGLSAVVAVLTPLLAGASALIFLIVGYVLKMLTPTPAFASTLLTTGWVFAAIAAAAILADAVGLLLTALHNGSTSLRAGANRVLEQQVAEARSAWQAALLERGILPFLQEAQADPNAVAPLDHPRATTGRMPHLGYHRPGFSSSDADAYTASPPGYSSPDFSSPDFGGPEHQPD